MSATTTATLSGSRLKSLADGLRQASTKIPPTSLSIAVIDRNPEQPRQHFDEAKLQQLAESIRARGVIQPILVRPNGGAGRYQIVVGERRWRAAQVAGLKEMPVVVQEMSDADALAAGLIENIDREDMIAADEVVAVARLAHSTSVNEAAAALGKTATWVSKRKRIAEAPAFVRDFLVSQATSDIEALYELAKLAGDDLDTAQRIVTNFRPGESLREQLRAASKELRSPEPQTTGTPEDGPSTDFDAQGDIGFDNAPALAAEDSTFSHAKTEGGEGSRTEDHATVDADSSGGATRSRTSDRVLDVVGVVRKKGVIVLQTASGDDVPCRFSDEALAALQRLLPA